MNESLINSAVSFLKDPNVVSSPINKKVEFLVSKGLNEKEVEEALRRSNDDTNTNGAVGKNNSNQDLQNATSTANHQSLDYYNMGPPALPERTWKDYFVMATTTAGVAYGLYQVVSRYLLPSLIPPTQKSIDDDKARIEEEFIKVDKLLEQMQSEQEEMKNSNEEKLKDIDTVISNVNDFLSRYNKDKLKFDDDLRLMKLEVDNLSNSIEKNMRINKEDLKSDFGEIQDEIVSLRLLINARTEKSSTVETSGGPRKIVPASSIPSASDILKKSKANAAGKQQLSSPSQSGLDISQQSSQQPSQQPSQQHLQQESQQPSPQLSHNEKNSHYTANNETADKQQDLPKPPIGIPEWQLNRNEDREKSALSTSGGGQDDLLAMNTGRNNIRETGSDDDVVNETLANVGPPSWQLHQSDRK